MRSFIIAGLLLALAPPVPAADLLGEAVEADTAVGDQVRALLTDAFVEDRDALDADVEALAARDDDRQAAGLARTGLTDDARYLAAALAPTRDARRTALTELLDTHPDPLVRRLAEFHLETDDAEAANRLLADDRHNRRAAVVNDAVRPLGVFSGTAFLAALNPILLAGSFVDSVVTTAVNLWHYNRLSSPEREALARYGTLLEREPDTRDAPEIARAIRRLGPKRAAALCTETATLGTKALDSHDLDHAAFYLHDAERLDGCADKVERPLEHLTDELATHRAREEAGRWPVEQPPEPEPGPEAMDYHDVAVATALGEPGAMIETAARFRNRHPESPFDASSAYVIAVARDLAGHRDAGREALSEVAGRDASVGRHAAAVLASADYDGLEAMREAERRHARDVTRFVLLGGNLDGRSAVYTATQLGADGLRAAQTVGMFNVVGLLSRAWQAWRHDPASNQAIIDRGEEFLARDPQSPDAPAVHLSLADAYERAGVYGRALMHYRATPEPSDARVARLERKMADQLLTEAERGSGNPALLEGIVQHFGATPAAEKARKRLAERPNEGEVVLDRDLLRDHPELLGPDALDLDPQLLDGDRANGEIAESGVTLAGGELRLMLENVEGSGQHLDTRSLAADAYTRARAAAREALYAQRLTADRRNPEVGRFERYIPIYLQGTFGDDGVAVYPGVKSRHYQSEDQELYQ